MEVLRLCGRGIPKRFVFLSTLAVLGQGSLFKARLARKRFENIFFEAERRGKLLQMKVFGAAIDSDKFSSKLELSSQFFGRLKFSALFE